MNSYQWSVRLPPAHREQQSCDHESKGDRVVPRTELGQETGSHWTRAGTPAARPSRSASSRRTKTTNQMLDGPALTLTGVRLTGLMVKSFFLRTLDLGMGTFADSRGHTVRRCSHEPNVAALSAPESRRGEPMDQPRRSAWRFGVPLVCLLAGLLLAATHGVSGGAEIRRSDAPRLVDLVREAPAVGGPAHL